MPKASSTHWLDGEGQSQQAPLVCMMPTGVYFANPDRGRCSACHERQGSHTPYSEDNGDT